MFYDKHENTSSQTINKINGTGTPVVASKKVNIRDQNPADAQIPQSNKFPSASRALWGGRDLNIKLQLMGKEPK